MTQTQFEAVFRPKKGNFFPKKIMVSRKFNVTETYGFAATVWVADTPEKNLKPTVCLVLSHNHDRLRLCFSCTLDMIAAISKLHDFLNEQMTQIHLKHEEALREFIEYHEKEHYLPPNDITVFTVIQGGKSKIDKRTGEILDGSSERSPPE